MIRWDKRMREKVAGKCCSVCGKAVDETTQGLEYIRTRQRKDVFIHKDCIKKMEVKKIETSKEADKETERDCFGTSVKSGKLDDLRGF